ncbi:MAG: class I SAM-dependent methyltransferase [Chloroflexi bacterium]|nr:class I SAM-dependent methyltransferase [Chloroflexota bacterium]MCL5274747.1 class I SAM-dependent methyltransferase [Chloroflexota bacterium]
MHLQSLKRYLHKMAARIVAIILRPGAVFDHGNFQLWERHGYHITPTHFYYPIPDTRDLKRRVFQASELPGIDLRSEFQLELIQDSFAQFKQEYNGFPIKCSDPKTFYLDNDAFTGIDPYIYYCMIRHFKPKIIVEVGSGYSTLLGAQAAQLNDSTRYVCIDPWPREFIARGVSGIEFIQKKVEDLDLTVFQSLQRNDILFIDSSHVIRTAGDVCFVILEVLPRLASGVIVHFHDIFLPFDYPKEWVVKQQRFWTEQYLLQAYLAKNDHAEVLFASHNISKMHMKEVQKVFPNALSIHGGSFWIGIC